MTFCDSVKNEKYIKRPKSEGESAADKPVVDTLKPPAKVKLDQSSEEEIRKAFVATIEGSWMERAQDRTQHGQRSQNGLSIANDGDDDLFIPFAPKEDVAEKSFAAFENCVMNQQ